MSNTRDTGFLRNAIQVTDQGVTFVSGSTTLMSISSSGAVTTTGVISGSNALSASFSLNSALLNGTGSVGFATTGALLEVSSSQQQISSSLLQVSASYISLSGSYTTFSGSASTRITKIENNYATTGSNSFRADQSITGSLVVSSTITAQTLVVQTVTSSIVYSSGSNIFGSALGDRQTFTGSVNITGSTHAIFGNVGIGKTNPISRLDISGSHTGGYGILNITSNDSAIISLDSTTSSDVRIRFKQLGVDKWFAGMHTNDSWELRVADNTPRFVVTNSGSVGIGTTNPPSTQLAVVADWISGQATVKTYPITTGGAAGYGIFDSNGTTRRAYMAANAEQVEVWAQQNTPMVLATNDIVRMKIDTGGRITAPYQPSFYAYGVGGGSYVSGNYWIFPSTQHNIGNHYNASNGVFTAPVAGIYFFAFGNLMGVNATVYRWYLRVNNSTTGAGPSIQLRMDRGGMSTSAYGWSHSKTAVVNLAAGDTVRIFSSADDNSNLFPFENGTTEEYPHFMGYLMG